MKIKITEKENAKEVEISFGLSENAKNNLRSFAQRALNSVVSSSKKAVQKVDQFIDEIVDEETREFREHMNEVVEQAKEDANRMAENAINAFMKKEEEKNNNKEKPSTFLKYLNKFVDYKCHSDSSNKIEEARKFMKSIQYPITPCSVQAFEKVLQLNGIISYENIAEEICNSEMNNEEIIETLHVEFNIWLKKNPNIKDNFPDANLIDLLKCFKNKFYNEEEIFEDESMEEETENNTSCEPKDDDYPEEVEEKETLEQKIAKIPEGKIFTLAEYLDYIYEYKRDEHRTIYEEEVAFLKLIEYPKLNSRDAFGIAACLPNVTYSNIAEMMLKAPLRSACTTNDILIKDMKAEFDEWLERRPDIKKYCPNANLRQLFVYFKKKYREK